MKRFVLVLLLLCLSWIVILTACNSEPSSDHTFAGATYTEPIEIPNFTLTGADGPVSLDDFAGQYVFAYFGYTFCPDVCPATLAELARVREQLGDEADKVQVLMVTVDPERDTPQKTQEYASHFDPSFIGLSGTKAEIDTAAQPFGIYYEKHEGSAESGYLVDHTARAFLIDTEGRARVAYPFEARAEAIVADLQYLFAQDG
ncbi:MAG: SCO family protein [Anaerolineae bacterium]|nr:SCO family protein [Anaerolineae bacterium]